MNYMYKVIDSPVGKLKLVASDDGLAAILWGRDDPKRVPLGTCVESPNTPCSSRRSTSSASISMERG